MIKRAAYMVSLDSAMDMFEAYLSKEIALV